MSLTGYIMEYLKNNFNFDYDNSFVRNTLENFVDYAVDNFNNSQNQLAYYLSDLIDGLTFEEVKKIIEEYEEKGVKEK